MMLTAQCPKCFLSVPVRQWEEKEPPNFEPNLILGLKCPHCGTRFDLPARFLQETPEANGEETSPNK